MKRMNFLVVGLMAAIMVPAAGDSSAAESVETCSTCAECTTELASGVYGTVVLDTDIVDHAGTCIDLSSGASNVTFDCNGHLIDGDDLASEAVRGISLMHGSGVTVTNCAISDFDSGVFLVDASGMEITANHIVSNRIGIDLSHADSNLVDGNTVRGSSTGIKISDSDNNTFSDNLVCDNFPWDFYFASGTGNVGVDNTCDSTSYWNDVGTTGCTFSCTVFGCGFESGNLGDWSSVTE